MQCYNHSIGNKIKYAGAVDYVPKFLNLFFTNVIKHKPNPKLESIYIVDTGKTDLVIILSIFHIFALHVIITTDPLHTVKF